MYRKYENPYFLEKRLKCLKNEYCLAINENADEEILINLHEQISDLEERIKSAWSDNFEEEEG